MNTHSKGFTLLELLIVISLVLTGAMILYNAYSPGGSYTTDPVTGLSIVTLKDGHDYNSQAGYYGRIYSHSASCRKCENRWEILLGKKPLAESTP